MRKSPGSTSSRDRKSTRLNSSHANISYAVFCLKKTQASFPIRFTPPHMIIQQLRWPTLAHVGGLERHAHAFRGGHLYGGYSQLRVFFFLIKGGPPEFHPFPPRWLLLF